MRRSDYPVLILFRCGVACGLLGQYGWVSMPSTSTDRFCWPAAPEEPSCVKVPVRKVGLLNRTKNNNTSVPIPLHMVSKYQEGAVNVVGCTSTRKARNCEVNYAGAAEVQGRN